MRKLTDDEIREFWRTQAVEHGQAAAASWSDQSVIDMEIDQIVARLDDGDRVLDVGCANGFSTIRFAAQRTVDILGVDYIPEMIEQARSRTDILRDGLRGTVRFETGDARKLEVPDNAYDKVVVIRVIINLGAWEQQVIGLQECARAVKPGGRLLLSEATVQGWERLNAFRSEWGLDPIPMPGFNNYLDQDKVVEVLAPSMRLVEIANFASSYYVGTRLLKPLLAHASQHNVDIANPGMHWNQWWAQLPAAGDYGVQKLFVFEKL